nr:protein-glutamate O-methyltransferase CheR [Campylobacter sp.]
MTQVRIHEAQMPILLEFIKKICGNDLSSKKEILKNKISLFCKNNGISSLDELIERINLDRYLRQNLINQI